MDCVTEWVTLKKIPRLQESFCSGEGVNPQTFRLVLELSRHDAVDSTSLKTCQMNGIKII